ncbi:hypothetical protein DFH27DRAFT_606826 [Peziza echinospora]|nr:hypothetical protein DFH27DRAFT_606826 [Peziza echinospora]
MRLPRAHVSCLASRAACWGRTLAPAGPSQRTLGLRRFTSSGAAQYTLPVNPDSLVLNPKFDPVPKPASLVDHLKERGLVESVTGLPGKLDELLKKQPVTAYAGIDPTASSLHVGHLLPLMNLLHLHLNGHDTIALIGKATASVGDPSGRATERDKAAAETVMTNFESIWQQVERFFARAEEYAEARGHDRRRWGRRTLRTNGEWLDGLGLVHFLANIGRHIRVQQMLARQSVKTRMDTQKGINFAEFTYQLLQSYDFWHLHKTAGCRLQIGGNDQYGNITAGIDLIQRLVKEGSDAEVTTTTTPSNKDTTDSDVAYGMTVPLLTTPSGEKFGKSAGNAVWLDETLTSPFELYQFFVKTPDDLIPTYLRTFTLLPLPTITALLADTHIPFPHLRTAHNTLARELVHLIHGAPAAHKAELMTRLLFPPTTIFAQDFSADEIIRAFEGDHRFITMKREDVVGEFITRVLAKAGVVARRSEAEAVAKAGGLYVGIENRRVSSCTEKVGKHWLIGGEILLVRIGKSKFVIFRLV